MATEGRVSDVGEFLKIDLTYSNYHTVFPKLIIYLLTLLGIVLIIKNVVNKMKIKKTAKKEDINNQEIDKDQPKEKFNVTMFVGTVILLIIYGFALDWFGFLFTTIIFIILTTLLYIGSVNKKAILISISNAAATTMIIWLVFGKLFDITLP